MQIISYSLSLIITAYALHKLYNYYKKKYKLEFKLEKQKTNYEVYIYEISESGSTTYLKKKYHQKVYKYKSITGSFKCLENEYRESLSSYQTKKLVDKLLTEYLREQYISNKKVIIITDEWISEIDIVTNNNSNILIFEITKK